MTDEDSSAMRSLNRGALCLAVPLLTACQADDPPAARPGPAVHYHAVIGGTPVHLALDDCAVFFVAPDGGREKVLETDFYPMLSACQVQTASADSEHITVELGRMALGAGGCCATEGTWRSRDGRNWERRVAGQWVKPGQEAAGKRRAGGKGARNEARGVGFAAGSGTGVLPLPGVASR